MTAPYFGGLRVAYPLIFITLFATLVALVRRRNSWTDADLAIRFLLGAFVLLAIAYLLTSRRPTDAMYILNFLMLALYAPFAQVIGKSAHPRNVLKVALFALVGTMLSAGIAFYQVFSQHEVRATGLGSDPIWSAQAAILLGFLALLGLTATRSRLRYLFLFGPLLGIFICLLSGSRGPLLAVPFVLLAYVVLGTRHKLRNVAIGLVLVIASIGAVWTIWPSTTHRYVVMAQNLPEFLQGVASKDSSLDQRKAMYLGSYQAFLHSPWIGYGWHAKVEAIVPYIPEKYAKFPLVHHHLHSDGLDFAVSGGILGILAYVLILAAPVVGAVWSPRDSQFRLRLTACVMLTVAYATFGLTYLLFGYEFHTTLYVVLAAILVRFCRDEPLAAASAMPSSAATEQS